MSISTLTRDPARQGESSGGFSRLLEGFRDRLEKELASWLAAKRQASRSQTPEAEDLIDHLERLMLAGGKRLRPALVYYSYRACGGAADEEVVPLALSTEFLHSYLLIHDDIMDHAEVRRNQPAAHAAFRERHRARGWKGDSQDFGRSAAILVGDLAQAYAVELFSQVLGRGKGRTDLQRCFAAMTQEVIAGQYLELLVAFQEDPSEEDLLRVLRLKSGRYSVERPIQLGALLAGAPPEILNALSTYGSAMGEAFQLQDDLLAMFGDPETLGKPVGGDLAEGKFTFLIYHTLRRASPEDRQVVRRVLGNPNLQAGEVAEVLQIIQDSGGLEAVRRMIQKRLETGRQALGGLELEPQGRGFLLGLADYLGERRT